MSIPVAHGLDRSPAPDPGSPRPAAVTAGIRASRPPGRLLRPADFARVLGTPIRLRSPHFALHHLAQRPLPTRPPRLAKASPAPVTASLSTELSTDAGHHGTAIVDDSREAPPEGVWLGLVVPKKFAKRAVTRNLVKRQIRQVVAEAADHLAPGLWVVRLRAPFDPARFVSAASPALKSAARVELQALLQRAARGERDPARPPRTAPAGARPC